MCLVLYRGSVVQDRHTEASPTAALKSLCAEFRRPSGTREISYTSRRWKRRAIFNRPTGAKTVCIRSTALAKKQSARRAETQRESGRLCQECFDSALLTSLSLTSQESRQPDRAS